MSDFVISATKNKQSLNTLITLVKQNFNIIIKPENITELYGGYCNVIYKISFPINTTDSLTGVILKIAPAPSVEMMTYEKYLLQTEVNVIERIEKETSIPCPHVLAFDDTCSLCNSPYFFMTIVPGQTLSSIPKPTPVLQDKYASTLGNYLKQLNSIHNSSFGLFMDSTSMLCKTNYEFILHLFRMTLDDGIKKNTNLQAISYDGMWELLKNNSNIFNEISQPSLVHWDLWEGNVFIQNEEVSGIIDFERALWGDPLMENSFSSFLQPSTSFLKAYGKTEFTQKENIRRQFYKIYRELVMIIECSYRQYDSAAQYNWVSSELKKDIPIVKQLLNNYHSVMINSI
jgi:fructosamine-3-kinase